MKLITLFTFLPLLLVTFSLAIMPLLTRRGIFFSATVDPEFPHSETGRRLLRSYSTQVVLWAVVAFMLAAVVVSRRPGYALLLPVLILVGGTGFSYWSKFREVHEKYGVRRSELRETSLSVDRKVEHVRFWLVLPPFIALAVLALYLHAHWDALPLQFPVHWGADGQPNRWASRNVIGVYGPLIWAAVMNLVLIGFVWLLSRIARKSEMLYITVRMIEVLLYPMTFTFVMVSLLPLYKMPVWLVPVVMLVFLAGIFYWAYGRLNSSSLRTETPDPQSDSFWKAGVFYFNPNDPSIFVAKRVGLGYTINFANKLSWLVLAGILLMGILPVLLVKLK